MQIDFHHGATYVLARLAGFDHDAAGVVAHAAQYVDDATQDGALDFRTGERYVRATSAHKTLDIKWNADAADNRLVWVPFHFLPGNAPPPAGTAPGEVFLRRMMCKPDSEIAREMVLDCVQRQDLPFALHRLGIALHTYVDTFAHQQFVGIVCDLNRLVDVTVDPDPAYVHSDVYGHLTSGLSKLAAFVAGHLPVGHAAATTLPDMPFLKWRFTRRNGETVVRDNPTDFLAAAQAAFNMARRYLACDPKLADVPLPAADAAVIDRLLRETLMIEGESRHAVWLQAIARGAFSFGPAPVEYVDQGDGSWKMQALGSDPDDDSEETFVFDSAFLTSHWKHFHDAVQHHRLFVVHELLPRFGLCAS
jgi:hypothetical protein